jgi:outer membrane phospholipase A
LYVLKYNLFPAYVAYTQKSLWNVGQQSMPFEENNYNPELFLDLSGQRRDHRPVETAQYRHKSHRA